MAKVWPFKDPDEVLGTRQRLPALREEILRDDLL